MTRVLVATTNRGKLAELLPMLAGLGWEAVGLDAFPGLDVVPEDEPDLPGNARAKALYYSAATGLPALADDSGLEVDALGGAPGVRSARYAGPDADDAANRAQLLVALSAFAEGDARRARFVCALCLVRNGAPLVEVTGRCEGRITRATHGTGGFGYDALFAPDDALAGGRTFAELAPAEKRAISHRGRALAALRVALDTLSAPTGAGTPRP